jgi:hypothetical protein
MQDNRGCGRGATWEAPIQGCFIGDMATERRWKACESENEPSIDYAGISSPKLELFIGVESYRRWVPIEEQITNNEEKSQ